MYPVLVYTYNGPTSQTVDFQFRIRKFETFVAVNFGVIVAIMDGRGTDSNGDKFMKSVAKNLGDLEMLDQLELASALRKETYTDDDKFAIWGWSYGGYVSSLTLFNENSPFRCAVSGAPVVDWLMYDSAYTERLMGSYAENRVGYEKSNLTQFARQHSKSFLRKRILLIHGTGDDNVHFQHSALLAKYLRTTKIELEFEVYPDMQHTPDEDTQINLYQKITKFLLNCYNLNYQQFYDQLNYQHLIGDVTSLNSKASEEGDKE
jgi:dipeptidyl aminopeptidase/acylaminoacyl peptidase